MMIYDISQEVFSCQVFPGDPAPEKKSLNSIENGDLYNLTAFSMCAHNGTHIDAPFHFLKDGKTVDELCLNAVIGLAYVAEHNGIVSGDDAVQMLIKAKEQNPEAAKRILIKGAAEVSSEAAKAFASSGVLLLGNESQTVGPEDAPMEVHLILLGADVVILEGVRLEDVSEGVYLLNAAPLNLSGADGSPCRAVLMSEEAEQRRSISPILTAKKNFVKSMRSISRDGSNERNMIYRELRTNEYDLLKEFLYEAIYVPEGVDPPDRNIVEQPELALYYEGFGTGKADHCIVAEDSGNVIGAVWTRIMDDYGHVDDDTPSFAISLLNDYRGMGVGTQLMEKMLLYLKECGFEKASLAVQKENYAVRMYKKVGFNVIDENAEELIMICDLQELPD